MTRQELDKLAGHSHHQGVLLKLTPFEYVDLDDLLTFWRQSQRSAFIVLLDGITDPHNFGAILRTAEVAGCHGVIVAKDRSCPVTPVVEKTAAGALSLSAPLSGDQSVPGRLRTSRRPVSGATVWLVMRGARIFTAPIWAGMSPLLSGVKGRA